MRISIKHPEFLHIQNRSSVSYGANQSWYSTWWSKVSGCGPTTTSNILWYLTVSRPAQCGKLFDGNGRKRSEMVRLMKTMFKYVTPTRMGVNKASILISGAVRYGTNRGVPLRCRTLEIPEQPTERPTPDEVYDFLFSAFSNDLPVAFLNLSNGSLNNLDNWHWVTLISTDENLQAEMYDQSRRSIIDLPRWLTSTTKGGAFVIIEP